MRVAIALFPRNTALDAVGPYEVLQRIPSIDVVFVGQQRGEVRTVIVNTHDQKLQVTTIADESENYTVAYPDTPDVMGLLRKHPSVSVVVRTPNGQAAWRCWPYLLLPFGLLVTSCALGVIVVRLLRSGLDASIRERDELEERLADLQHRDRRVKNSS